MGQPNLPDIATFIKAGIDPKTRLPSRLANVTDERYPQLKAEAKREFRIQDEQRAVNSFKWYNLPAGLSSQELERFLYYRYSLCFFYMEDLGEFYFMPYALDGTLDYYQRYNTIHPVPMCEGNSKEEKEEYNKQKRILSLIKLDVQKDVVVMADEITKDKLTKSAVILRDYTNQMEQMGEPRYSLNEHLLDMKADCLCFLRTNLLVSSGIQGLRVSDADSSDVYDAASSMYHQAIVGNPYIALTQKADIQEIQPTGLAKSQEYFLAMQSIDNMLLATHGIENTGIFNKQAHILESENQVNATNVSLVLMNRLAERQKFCNIVNSIWGLGIWCELSENVSGLDINGDGVNYDEDTGGESSGYSADEGGEE